MFLAIINDTYTVVKEELSSQKDELHITDIIKQVSSQMDYILHQMKYFRKCSPTCKCRCIANVGLSLSDDNSYMHHASLTD